ncbi:hypothetical protein QTP88_016376 [Uroleucon formosanum]
MYINCPPPRLPSSRTQVKKLEASGILLSESIHKIKQIETTLALAPNVIGETILNKPKNILMKNNVFNDLKNISAILDGENTTSRDEISELTETAKNLNSKLIYIAFNTTSIHSLPNSSAQTTETPIEI